MCCVHKRWGITANYVRESTKETFSISASWIPFLDQTNTRGKKGEISEYIFIVISGKSVFESHGKSSIKMRKASFVWLINSFFYELLDATHRALCIFIEIKTYLGKKEWMNRLLNLCHRRWIHKRVWIFQPRTAFDIRNKLQNNWK